MAGGGDDQGARKRTTPPSWPDLPPDVLRLIACYLTTIWDYLRFRGVCSSFRSAADSPPSTPSLLLPYDPASTSRSFLDPSDRSVHTLRLPETRRKYLYGTPHGWLVMLGLQQASDRWLFTVALLNPITRAQIPLPSLPREITRLPELDSDALSFEQCSKRTKPLLTATPASDGLLALLIYSDLAVCRLGVGGTWTVVKLGTPSVHRVMLDLAYLDNAFYVVDDSKGVSVISIKTMKKQYSKPPPGSRSMPHFNTLHLAETSSGLLLFEVARGGYEPTVSVFKLDRGGGGGGSGSNRSRKLKWVRVEESLGELAFFMSNIHSCISQSSSVGFLRGWGRDVVCYTSVDCKDDERYGEVHVTKVGISDIVAGSSVERQPCYWQHTWRAPTPRRQNLNGLTWMVTSTQQSSLSIVTSRVPYMTNEDDSTRGEKNLTGEIRGAGEPPNLPSDVLLLILEKLTSPWDYVRFRGVCSSWRSAASPANRLPPQVPSLLLPYDLVTTARSFFDPSDRQVHTINIPEARGKWLYGTPYGWLVMLGEEEEEDGWRFNVALLNPVTRAQILLPQLPQEITRLPEQQIDESTYSYSSKPLLTGNPAPSQGCPDVIVGLLIFSRLAFCRLGQGQAWTVTDLGIPSAPRRFMVEFTYFGGAFYVVDISRGVTVLSTNPVMKKYSAPPSTRPIPHYHTLHLAVLSGDLLLLEIRDTGANSVIHLEKLDRITKKLKWASVKESTDDYALFMSHNHSTISLCPCSFAGTGRGLICFARDEYKHDGRFGYVNIATVCMSHIDPGISIRCGPYYWQGSRRPPTHRKSYRGLTWIIPSPC